MAKIIDGKGIAQSLRREQKERVERAKRQGIEPMLTVMIVGEDPASQVYVRNKERACQEVGIRSRVLRLPADISQRELLEAVEQENRDDDVDGILVQLPLPTGLEEMAVIDAIDPDKDVDGFTEQSAGRLMIGKEGFVPCTPRGCLHLIASTGMDIAGKRAVVLGRSNIVGKPMALLLLRENATVTLCHSKTENLPEIACQADILVAAIGREGFVTGDMIKQGAVVIDVGINRGEDGKLHGDVDYASVSEKAGWITPVPGGVGPMTIAMLLENTIESALRRKKKRA